jgi:hypothetical protein
MDRASASSYTRMLTSVSSLEVGGLVGAPLPVDRALAGQLLELGHGGRRHQRHVGAAGQQSLDLLQADLAAAHDEAAPPAEPQTGDVEGRVEHPLHARLIAHPLAELADALLAAVGLRRHRPTG